MAGNKVAKKVIPLIHGLKQCWPDFDVTPNDFLQPTLNSVIKFYNRFIQSFGIKNDTIIMLLNQHFPQCPEYEDIIYLYVLYSCANRIYQQLHLTSLPYFALSFTNIINPAEDKHLVSRISFLANYLYYAFENINIIILPLKTAVLDKVDAVVDINKEVEILNERLQSLDFTHAKLFDKSLKLNNNIEILKLSNTEAEFKSEELSKKIKILNAELKLVEEENNQLTDSVQKNMAREKQLEDLIVDDHDNILNELNKLEKELAEEQELLTEYMTNLVSKTKNEPYLFKNLEVMRNFIQTLNLNKILETYDSIAEHANEKAKVLMEIDSAHKIDNDVRDKIILLNKEEVELQTAIQAADTKYKDSNNILDNEIKTLTNEYKKVKLEFDKSAEDAAQLNRNVMVISAYCDQYKQGIEADNIYYEKRYKEILNARNFLRNEFLSILAIIKKEIKLDKTDSKSN